MTKIKKSLKALPPVLSHQEQIEMFDVTLARLREYCVDAIESGIPFTPHQLILLGIAEMIQDFTRFCVTQELKNGK